MDDTANRPYRYIHPAHIRTTLTRTESAGTQLIFTCPLCGGTASFSTVLRVGQCFGCQGIIKLHTMYDTTPIEELLPTHQLPPTVPSTEPTQADRVEIITRPLSQSAYDYIRSRGIDLAVVTRFGCLTETTYHDRLYLAWPTVQGDYELRATFAAERGQDKITPRGHHKHVSLVQLQPDATTCIVCEGMFSALSHAQLFPRNDVWYVLLNSTSNWPKFVELLGTGTQLTQLALALDNDPSGRATAHQLTSTLQQTGVQITLRLPPNSVRHKFC